MLDCVRGRGLALSHHRIDHEAETLPVLACDFVSLGAPPNAGSVVAICIKDHLSGAMVAHTRPNSKGDAEAMLSRAFGGHQVPGFKRLVLKYDQEPALMKICDNARIHAKGIEAMLEAAPVGDKQGHGEAENTVKWIWLGRGRMTWSTGWERRLMRTCRPSLG